MVDLTQHSPLGGSGAYRWMPCPGSVALSYGIEEEESEYAVVGTAAHALAQTCLIEGKDAWELIGYSILPSTGGMPPEGPVVEADKPMADAVQVYLNAVRSVHLDRNQGNSWVEREFYCPDLHEYFWGKTDFVFLDVAASNSNGPVLHVWDYKHGAGIVVEVVQNPQLMYYACGALEDLDLWFDVESVVLHIAQPRGFHFDGPLREWTIGTDDLEGWKDLVLIPAMDRALVSKDTASGEHCRFCPARARACPQLLKDFDEMEKLMRLDEKNTAKELTNAQVGRFLDLLDVAKIAGKAAGKTAFARMEAGKKIPGRKLVKQRSNREWREEAEAALKEKFGDRAYTQPELKSPPKIEELLEGGKMTAQYAFKPDKGLALAREDDKRMAVTKDMKALFESKEKAYG